MKRFGAEQVKGFIKKNRIWALAACILMVCALIAGAIFASVIDEEDWKYRESAVLSGNLTVGVTESGTIDIGTVEQTFDLDMSALQRVTTNNSNSSGTTGGSGDAGGMGATGRDSGVINTNNPFGQMFNLGGNSGNTESNSSSRLVVEDIYVSVGQTVAEGDVLLKLENEGVDELKNELEGNVEKASADLEALIADQKLSTITADYTLENALSYGDTALKEKNATIDSLKQEVTDATDALEAAKKSLSHYEEQLATARVDYSNAVSVMNNAVWTRDHTNKKEDLYLYVVAFNDAQLAISNAESLESRISQLEGKVEAAKTDVARCETTLAKAKRAYALGVITAEETYEIQMLAYDTAQETYDISVSYLEEQLAEQQKTYDETVENWNDFTSHINGYNVCSDFNGVITLVSLAKGDKLGTGSVVVTLYDSDDITMTVTVSEEKMSDIKVGGKANIYLTAYPDEMYTATVAEIGDATTDSSGNTTCDVTVRISGDVSGLFQGMTGKVTFITKQLSDIIYVSNRAIIRENGKSYVKVKRDNGSIEKVRVETGFSDGVNVEIVEGLTEGQIVIIEKGES